MEIKIIQHINSMMKIQFRHTRVFTFLLTLLLLGGAANQAWAYKVIYHILTRPIVNSIYHMDGSENVFEGKRLEAVRVVDNNATTVNLPEAYKSPLAKNFKYYDYANGKVTKSATAVAMYNYSDKNKAYHYTIANDAVNIENATVTANMDVYVTYEYDDSKGIALDGSKPYNLTMGDGFLAFNRGRNNRVAVFPKSLGIVSEEALASEDFVQLPYDDKTNLIPGTNISAYWKDNKNTKAAVAGQFHFLFKLWGSDPYNIIIGTAYDKDYAYLEKHGSESSLYYKWYKGSHLFRPADEKSGFFLSSDDHKEYTTAGSVYDPEHTVTSTERSGYFKSKGSVLTYSTFALLNNSDENGYVFMVSNFVNGNGEISTPGDYKSATYNFLIPDGNYNNLTYASKTLPAVSKDYSTDEKIYEVKEYVYKVIKKISGGELLEKILVSDYSLEENPVNFIPESLRRKYVTYKAYSDKAMTNEVTNFTNADANCADDPLDAYPDCKVIYLKYETNMPFETWTEAGGSDTDGDHITDYDELTWYNIHAEKNTKYIASWDGSKIVTRNVDNGYPRVTHFAFIGDPYDLKIVGRKSSQDGETPSTLKYMALNATLANNVTFETTATIWGIIYDDDTADNRDCFRLKDNSGDKYLHLKDASGENYPLNGTATSTEAVRVTVDPLPNKSYIYHIMRSDGSIATKATDDQEPSAKLDFAHIPETIRSPFLALTGVTLSFYNTSADASTPINAITYAPDNVEGAVQDIYVRYNMGTALDNLPGSYIKEGTATVFNVRLNGQYIYYDNETIKTTPESAFDDACATNPAYQWKLGGNDPYAMTILNADANKYVTVDYAPLIEACQAGNPEPDGEITWSDTPSKFIIKGTSRASIYEVMAALGDGVDSRSNYFNIGCPSENTVKLYGNESHLYNSAPLRFQLTPTTGTENLMYHLIDNAGKDLLQMPARQVSTGKPEIPEYWSPLVKQYHYYKIGDFTVVDNVYTLNGSPAELGQVTDATDAGSDGVKDIFVTYTANDLVDMSGRTTYLMKYAQGENFRQEDGVDGLLPPMSEFEGTTEAKKYRYQAVYPYCNGDCNFFVYGQEQYDIQQQGAASTRTRWAWYVESVNNDPYHVKIFSRQQETYPAGSGNDYNAYFRTYAETFGGSKHIVTTLAWPGISGVQGTEYMVLGSAGQFRLVTTDAIDDDISNERRTVNSFEQYWKTWNTIRKIVLGDENATARQSDPNTVPATPATDIATAEGKNNRTYLTDVMGWHSYEQWAYAIRWNDYNKNGDKNKKGWEPIEHWYQTVNMGEGYFDFVKTTIEPVLILLDQHGWEIMRKPIPTSPEDPEKYAKYDALRLYDSPMVKEYAFWSTAKKRTGFHQYYLLSDRIGGEDFTSTSLTYLPPYDSENVKDAKGNLLDQYVTYIVKDEYAQTYNPSNKTGQPFMIQQGSHFAYNNSDATEIGTRNVPAQGGMSQYIIENVSKLTIDGDKENELWYVKPNADIDIEMGYQDANKFPGGYAHNWDSKTPNAYEDDKYKNNKIAVYVKETTEYKNASADDKKKLTDKYGEFSFSNGFDPYNIQISSDTKYFVTNASKAEIQEGSILGDGTTNTLGVKAAVEASLVGGMDNRTLQMTNATFMAVKDEDGNMQLMPRFDNEKRLKDFSTLVETDDAEKTKTYTKLYRPLVYNYHIIDNSGNESLRYQGGGDLVPQIPEWFQSQLAKDYKYYKNLTKDGDVYTEVRDKTDISAKEITESLEGAAPTDNNVYVRYSYDKDADSYQMLQGKWLTMKLSGKDAVYSEGVKQGDSKPDPIDASHKDWQWKFVATSQTDPDPYAVSLYNRNTAAGTATTISEKTKFALLNWYDGAVDPTAYTLAVAGTGLYTYDFVNGAGMTTEVAATTATENGVKSTSCSFSGTGAKIELNDDVHHTYTYRIYTNDDPVNPAHEGKYGDFAVSAGQDYTTVAENNYVPILPEEIKSPLLNMDQFKYYGAVADMGDETKELKNIFGLYDDDVYVRYTAYDLKKTEYKVPNVKGTEGGHVAKGEGSNDAALDINNELLYNIIWYNDNMMQSTDGTSITGLADQELQGGNAYVWKFEGNDPYAIKIKHNNSEKYVKQDTGDIDSDENTNECMLSDAATSFMLLPSTDVDWQYGMLQVTGGTNKLSGSGNSLVAEDPTKFIIFGLSTHKVIYHLLIKNIGGTITIPYRETKGGTKTTKVIDGSTQRDLTTTTTVTGDTYQLGETKNINGNNVNYCVDDGHITLGDPLKVPEALKRPNCKYFYYVEGIYTNEACTIQDDLNTQYEGLQITQMGTEPALLGKTVVINVEYQFNDGLPTNNGSDFVTDPSQKKWYTVETSDDTPLLAQYTGAAGFKMLEGRESHYTNDFLWSPVGDPYGFKMYNRYEYKTNGATTHVMTTEAAPADGGIPKLLENTGDYASRAIYELFDGDTDGYFFMRPLLNNDVAIYNNNGKMELSSTNATEYAFGLSLEQLKPYYDRAGYVGGLNDDGKAAYDDAAGNLQTIQGVVYDDANIVTFTPGYYRLHSQPDIKNLPQRYLSGYLHKTELTSNIPMHFYEKKGVSTTFEALGATGYTTTTATRGQLPISAPEYDPASIFHITGTLNGTNNSLSTINMSTQGLYVKENKMTATPGDATLFTLMDIGGAVLLIHDNATPASRKYFCFDQTDPDKIYDIQWEHGTPTDYAKWCLEPANNMGLYIETHSGGEEEVLTDIWYYSSYCVPFDLLIANKDEDEYHSSNAYTCVESESPWNGTMLHPKSIGKYTVAAGIYPDALCKREDSETHVLKPNDYFVPAGTPVLFSTKKATEYIKATIPTTSPSTPISTIFSAKYLEQLLPDWDNSKRVYVFGPKMEGTLDINTSDGTVNATLPSLGNTNVGFHLNANPNKEAGTTKGSWTRNNYYVLHNKIYYLAGATPGASAPQRRAPEFVPVIFDDEEGAEELNPDGTREMTGDGCVYDLMGRKVATREQVEDGSWKQRVATGIYIINGKKIRR